MSMKLLLIPQRYEFSSKSQRVRLNARGRRVVADTTKVRIFKQITTISKNEKELKELLLIPQRYEFSSKSQRLLPWCRKLKRCCWYHKGTNFQANHNRRITLKKKLIVVADTTKVRIFKQITTPPQYISQSRCCCWYHKGTNFQANHNWSICKYFGAQLLLIPQRYEFSSKSQLTEKSPIFVKSCCWYHKGTNFQANHNYRY